MRWLWLAVLISGCSAPCPVDPTDAGCVTAPECADAGEGVPCGEEGTRCRLCIPSYHSFAAACERARDGGLEWVVSRGIPPRECVP